jgi:hypothetical protein
MALRSSDPTKTQRLVATAGEQQIKRRDRRSLGRSRQLILAGSGGCGQYEPTPMSARDSRARQGGHSTAPAPAFRVSNK